MNLIEGTTTWLNANQGVVTLLIFVAMILLGWVSGIFSALRRRPKLDISVLEGPSFCCTYPVEDYDKGRSVHRTAIALYLKVANTGFAPTSLEEIQVGYHWHLRPLSWLWIRYRLGWCWITHQTVALDDFQVAIGENIKVYPFLVQRNALATASPETYLEVGQTSNGVVYFEQGDNWGGAFPSPQKDGVQLKVCIRDTRGSNHCIKAAVPSVSLEEGQKFNPKFGETLKELRENGAHRSQ